MHHNSINVNRLQVRPLCQMQKPHGTAFHPFSSLFIQVARGSVALTNVLSSGYAAAPTLVPLFPWHGRVAHPPPKTSGVIACYVAQNALPLRPGVHNRTAFL